jgi:hypothetical protein
MTKMARAFPVLALAASLLLSGNLAQAPEKLDYAAIASIRDEGLNRSQVMDHIGWLTDVFGPRLTGGPGIKQASDWAIGKFTEWGLANPHRETFAFGKGWSLVRFSAHLLEPQVQPLIGFPAAWTPGTNGAVTADVVRVQIDSDADFERYRGKLSGRIVLTQPERDVPMLEGLVVHRMDRSAFEEAATTPVLRAPAPAANDDDDEDDDEDRAGAGRGARERASSLGARRAVLQSRGSGRHVQPRQRRRDGLDWQQSHGAAAAHRWRHDLSDRQRIPRRGRRHRRAERDSGG